MEIYFKLFGKKIRQSYVNQPKKQQTPEKNGMLTVLFLRPPFKRIFLLGLNAPFDYKQFGDQNRTACRAAQRVMRQFDEFLIV